MLIINKKQTTINSCVDAATTPTPISTISINNRSPLCITPTITSCDGDIPDGTKIKYIGYTDCNFPHMLFTHGADGTLTHHCSGKKVCPSTDGQYLIISSSCDAEKAKYERTSVCILFFAGFSFYRRFVLNIIVNNHCEGDVLSTASDYKA